ncbi:MAG: type II toxin-antitoxin system RelE/ParE family toxin [Rubrivivax sp.]|nr:type II toxin-antitoxin system RelE/ParE family toxin [Rubrivivax sp.]
MRVIWTSRALSDLLWLHAFLAPADPRAARSVFEQLKAGPRHLQAHPRLGERVPDFGEREVRRLIVGDYEMRYEVKPDATWILRLWHSREDR